MDSFLRRPRVLLLGVATTLLAGGLTALVATAGEPAAPASAVTARADVGPLDRLLGRGGTTDGDQTPPSSTDIAPSDPDDAPWWQDPRVAADDTVHAARGQAELERLLAEEVAPGDLVLLDRGVYAGDVQVTTPGITLRGIDRNAVVFDGEHERGNAITVSADDVALENMRARDFTGNGFYWTGVEGYAGRYLTTERIGLYGIYAFDSVDGVFEDSFASGSADAGFYIGQCEPCEAVVRRVTAEFNALGYSGTNAGGDLFIEDSVWRDNAAGVVPNSLDSQEFAPQSEGTVIRDNLFERNGNPDTPSYGIAGAIIGHGVALAGGRDNLVADNEFIDTTDYGVVIHPLPDDNLYLPGDNTVRGNTFRGSGVADLALAAGSDTGNCFEGNDFTRSLPVAIEDLYPCEDGPSLADAPLIGDPVVLSTLAVAFAEATAGTDGRPSYTAMPDAADEPAMPAPLARDGGVTDGGRTGIPDGYRQGR